MRYNSFIFSYRLSLICKSIDRWIHVRKTLLKALNMKERNSVLSGINVAVFP